MGEKLTDTDAVRNTGGVRIGKAYRKRENVAWQETVVI